MISEYKLIVFDWDGTLMDSVDHITYCLRKAMHDMAMPDRTDEELQQVIGLGLEEAMIKLVPGRNDAFYEAIVQSYREHWLGSPPGLTRFYEGIPDLLQEIHDEGIPMAIATGKSRRGLDKQLVEENIGHLFAATRCADESVSKPAPDMLHEIMQELSVAASETLMIGDTEYDMQMAQAAGCDSVAVSYGVHDEMRLSNHQPVGLVNTPAQLAEWVAIYILEPRRKLVAQ